LGLALIGTASALLVATRSASAGESSDVTAAGILGAIGLLVLASCWGLWRTRRWGWWLALMINLGGLITFLWDPITRRVKPDSDELAFIIIFAVLAILLTFAPVRRLYLRHKEISAEGTES